MEDPNGRNSRKYAEAAGLALAGLRKHIGTGGLIGAGIGLAYTPLSVGAIRMAYAFEGNALVEIIAIPAVPFFLFASYVRMDVVGWPGCLFPLCLFTALGAGIGAGVHWTNKLVKRIRGQPYTKQ